jgi:uncharacterized membrane protein
MMDDKSNNETDMSDAEKNKNMAALSYFSFLCVIPLLAGRKSPFVRFHLNQGIALAIAEGICVIVRKFLNWIFSMDILSFLRAPVNGIYWVLIILLMAISVRGIMNVIYLQKQKLPIFGNIKILR